MKKIFASVLLIGFLGFLTQEAISQANGKIKYTAILELSEFEKLESTLAFDEDESYFWISKTKDEEGGTTTALNRDENTVIINIEDDSDENFFELYINRRTKEIIRSQSYFENGKFQDCRVIESTGIIDWQISDETKVIGSFEAIKATATFRGRNYTAWFAPNLPISLGPWIFHGLPGLILELYDEDMGVQFYLDTVKIPYELEEAIEPPREGKKITLKEYVAYKSKWAAEFVELIKSKLPRGAEVSDISYKENNTGIEREY